MKHKNYAPVTPFERQTSHCPLYVAWLVLDEARDYFRTNLVPSPGSATLSHLMGDRSDPGPNLHGASAGRGRQHGLQRLERSRFPHGNVSACRLKQNRPDEIISPGLLNF